MRRLLVFIAMFHLTNCDCFPGFELVRAGECRGKYTTITVDARVAESVSESSCQEIGGHSIIIHDEEHQSHWFSHLIPSRRPELYIVCNSNSKRWQWGDGSAIDYKPPVYSEKLNQGCTDDPGCGWSLEPDGRWDIWCPDSEVDITIDVFCTTQLTQPVPASDGCEGFEDDSEDGVCYQVGTSTMSWRKAQMMCLQLGADLASIHNSKENSFVRRLAVSRGAVDGLFLGATLSGKGDNFGWIDGSKWNYDNFYNGFPVDGLGDCVAMDTLASSGQWLNTNCSANLAYACVRKQNGRKPVCNPGPWNEGQIIYTPGFPFDASTPCEILLSVDPGKRVALEVNFLEANTCCDRLVLADELIGGVIVANLTGEITNKVYTTRSSNFMRVSWQPNGGVNVRGAIMTFRGV